MNPTRERDFRLDFCRGIALIVIFIDHVPGNPLSSWTLRNFSFCDAAEVFVLISGMASYLAYGSRLSKLGFKACARAVGRNCARIYLAHLLLIVGVAGLMVWIAGRYSGADYIDSLKLQWFTEDPRGAIFAAVTLSYLPRLMDILPMYVLLLAAAPFLIVIIKRDYRIALLISAALYLLAWNFGWNLSADRSGREWYFNPFAWQLLYTIGLVVSHLSRTEPDKLPWGHRWLRVAIGFLAITMLIAWPLNQLGLTQMAPFSYIWPADKTYLSPLRIINVLALLYVFAFYVPPKAAWLKKRVAELCISCGRHSLTIYGLGLLFSCVGYVVIQESSARAIANLEVNVVGISLLILTAVILDRRDEARRAAAPALRIRSQGSAAA
ncbi:MAG TPA: OpgC domain-containing protein [Candidatus Binataceae bacterium]|nr:OpgC domain-containing protein [Candidatus Binataceae bacterium]